MSQSKYSFRNVVEIRQEFPAAFSLTFRIFLKKSPKENTVRTLHLRSVLADQVPFIMKIAISSLLMSDTLFGWLRYNSAPPSLTPTFSAPCLSLNGPHGICITFDENLWRIKRLLSTVDYYSLRLLWWSLLLVVCANLSGVHSLRCNLAKCSVLDRLVLGLVFNIVSVVKYMPRAYH